MKVKLIQAVVIGTFILIGMVVSSSEIEMFKKLACDSLVIRGENAHVVIEDGKIAIMKADTNEVVGIFSLEASGESAIRANNLLATSDMTSSDANNSAYLTQNLIVIRGDDEPKISLGFTKGLGTMLSMKSPTSKTKSVLLTTDDFSVLKVETESGKEETIEVTY